MRSLILIFFFRATTSPSEKKKTEFFSYPYPLPGNLKSDMCIANYIFVILVGFSLSRLTESELAFKKQRQPGQLKIKVSHESKQEIMNFTNSTSSLSSNSWTDAIAGDPSTVSSDGQSEGQLTPDNYTEFLSNPISLKGYNQMYYKGFVFNEEFAVKNCSEADRSTYERVQAGLRNLSYAARQNNLTNNELSKWYPVARALWWSFYDENGTLAYVNSTSFEGWIFCGCVNLKNTYVNESNHFRMCAPTASVGLKSISRAPIEGYDYLGDSDAIFSSNEYFFQSVRNINRSKQGNFISTQQFHSLPTMAKILPEYDFASATDGSLDGECKSLSYSQYIP